MRSSVAIAAGRRLTGRVTGLAPGLEVRGRSRNVQQNNRFGHEMKDFEITPDHAIAVMRHLVVMDCLDCVAAWGLEARYQEHIQTLAELLTVSWVEAHELLAPTFRDVQRQLQATARKYADKAGATGPQYMEGE